MLLKNLTWVLSFVVLCFIGDRVFDLFISKAVKNSQFRYSRLYRGNTNADILLVGNSRGLIFYQPYIEKITGKSTFNISYNGMPIDLAEVLIADYLERNSAPDKLILDVTMCFKDNVELSAGFAAYQSFSPRLEAFIESKAYKTAYANKLFHLTQYNSEVFQRALFYRNKSDKDWLLDRVITQKLIADSAKIVPITFKIRPKLFNSLKAIVALCKAKNIEPVFVVNPYFPPFAKRITNLKPTMEKIEQMTGVKVHDYSLAVPEFEGCGDYQHLNKKGSKKYLDILKKDGLL